MHLIPDGMFGVSQQHNHSLAWYVCTRIQVYFDFFFHSLSKLKIKNLRGMLQLYLL